MNNKQKLIGPIIILTLFIIFLVIGYTMIMPKKVSSSDVFVQSMPLENKDFNTIILCINRE